MVQNLDKNIFKEKFGTWWPYIEPGFHLLEPVYKHLKERSSKHVRIFPNSEDTFRAFTATPYKDVSAIWMGMSPYFSIWKGQPIADGLCFSSNGEEEPPSLRILYDSIERDIGEIFLERPLKLDYLAEQGILMLNAALTTEQGEADSHIELWKPFMKYLTKEVFQHFRGVPIISFGNAARDVLEPYITKNHLYRHLKHPSFFHRQKIPMDGEGTFKWMNEQIVGNNGMGARIEFNYHDLLPF